jgi:hypothetical protein
MIADDFYRQIIDIFASPPKERHAEMVKLHGQVVSDYITAVQKLSEQDAIRPVSIGSDNRTLAEIIAHIAEWERFGIMAAGDILAGLNHPRMVTDVRGFVDTDGQTLDFVDVHEFNAYQQQKYATWSWPQLQKDAIDYASTLYSLFAYPNLLTAERLERSKPHQKKLRNGEILDNTTMGWCLWVIYLDHEAVEHATELKLPFSP